MDFLKYYDEYFLDVYRLVYSYTLNKEDTEDICQRTFLKLYNYLKNNQLQDDYIKKWLFKVAINDSKNILINPFKKHSLPLENDNLMLSTPDFNLDLIDALRRIPIKYRKVLYLYYYEGYSIKEISELLKLNESTIKTRLKRGKEKLRKEYQ